jgi:hypothetical protein
MDATKSKTLNSTLRLVFSLAHSIFLVFTIIFIYVILGELRMPSAWFLTAVLTAVSFGITFFLNMITQYMACQKINAVQIASASSIPAGITAVVTGIVSLLPVLESPIRTVLPETLTPIYKKAISQGFYIFWGGMYGQVLASGFAQVCSA